MRKRAVPRSPQVWRFRSEEDAYDASQTCPWMRDGDVLISYNRTGAFGPNIAVLVQAWPTWAAGAKPREFHKLEPEVTWESLEGGRYLPSAVLAEQIFHGMMRAHGPRRVTNGSWNVGTSSFVGSDHVTLQVFQFHGLLTQRGDGDGLRFPTVEAANAYALEHGYLQIYRTRIWCRKHRVLHSFLGHPSPTFDPSKCERGESWQRQSAVQNF